MTIQIAGEDLQFVPAKAPHDLPVTGEVIAKLSGAKDVKEFIVIQWLENGQLETIRADEKVRPKIDEDPRFIIFRSASTYRFEIDEQCLEWGAAQIRGDVLKKLAGVDPMQFGVWQQKDEGDDLPIENDEFADLRPEGLEIFFTAKRESTEGSGR